MAHFLIIDDEVAITSLIATYFERNGGHAVTRAHTGREGVGLYLSQRPDLVFLDLRLPDMTGFEVLQQIRQHGATAIMMTGHGDVSLAVEAMQNGAENFLVKPVELRHLGVIAERALEKVRLQQANRYLTTRRGDGGDRALVGSSGRMREVARQAELLASSGRTTGLILGEGGTGKARVAAFIHSSSARAQHAFVEVNCAALTPATLDTDLFGSERGLNDGEGGGARQGLLELADGGTLFLDEIGDLDPVLQPKLLGVLEGKPFRRLGGTREISTDVRLLAASSKDLLNEAQAGRFREDLYYRLSVMPLVLPPLRSRTREDLVELIASVLDELQPQLAGSPGVVSDAALELLLKYVWPGNVRELQNVLERAMLMARGTAELLPEDLPSEVRGASGAKVESYVPRSLEDMERAHIHGTLQAHNMNRTHAARELGISRATLIKKIKQFGLTARAGAA